MVQEIAMNVLLIVMTQELSAVTGARPAAESRTAGMAATHGAQTSPARAGAR